MENIRKYKIFEWKNINSHKNIIKLYPLFEDSIY